MVLFIVTGTGGFDSIHDFFLSPDPFNLHFRCVPVANLLKLSVV